MRQADKTFNRVRVLRQNAKMSRKVLAAKLGIDHRTLGYIEREEYKISLALAYRLSDVFGLPLGLVFSATPMRDLADLLREGTEPKDGPAAEPRRPPERAEGEADGPPEDGEEHAQGP